MLERLRWLLSDPVFPGANCSSSSFSEVLVCGLQAWKRLSYLEGMDLCRTPAPPLWDPEETSIPELVPFINEETEDPKL